MTAVVEQVRAESKYTISITDHAVERFVERARALAWRPPLVRQFIGEAFRKAEREGGLVPHWAEGQRRFAFTCRGVKLWGVVALSLDRDFGAPYYVATVLTDVQVQTSLAERPL